MAAPCAVVLLVVIMVLVVKKVAVCWAVAVRPMVARAGRVLALVQQLATLSLLGRMIMMVVGCWLVGTAALQHGPRLRLEVVVAGQVALGPPLVSVAPQRVQQQRRRRLLAVVAVPVQTRHSQQLAALPAAAAASARQSSLLLLVVAMAVVVVPRRRLLEEALLLV